MNAVPNTGSVETPKWSSVEWVVGILIAGLGLLLQFRAAERMGR